MNKRAGSKRHSPIFLAVFAVFLVSTLICVAGTCVGIVSAKLGNHDTRWYWASARLLVHGGNPYDDAAVAKVQREVGIGVSGHEVVRNPPPVLFLIAPLGWAEPRVAVLVWGLLLAGCLALALLTIKKMLHGERDRKLLWLAWCFAPALCCVEVGQTGVFPLLGLAIFLRWNESRPWLAGAALSLCAIKPHFFGPFMVVLLVWIVVRRCWAVLGGAVVAFAAESALAMAFDRAVWSQYVAGMRTQSFEQMPAPTMAVALRLALNRGAMSLEFVPAAVACAWGLWYFARHRSDWDWRRHGSLLILVSLVTAPYSWFTDQVIVIPPILFALSRSGGVRKGSMTLLLAVMSAAAIEMILSPSLYYKPFLWQGWAWLAWYLFAVSGTRNEMHLKDPALTAV
jgi:hypothetical protein